ncbi:MAG: polysaccharide biosynthesis protein [Hyphomicrobium sp.]
MARQSVCVASSKAFVVQSGRRYFVKTFQSQIEAGGPVTVTRPAIVRYFMSIPEVAELVIQAGAMAKGGEVFVLDMGAPVRIDDLARLMVRLMGLEVKSEENPEGDVAITYTGLKPGEKLYEELLVGANLAKTEHPRIRRSDEPFLSQAELDRELELLEAAMKKRNVKSIQAVLSRTVEGYEAKMHAHEGKRWPFAVWAPHSPALH